MTDQDGLSRRAMLAGGIAARRVERADTVADMKKGTIVIGFQGLKAELSPLTVANIVRRVAPKSKAVRTNADMMGRVIGASSSGGAPFAVSRPCRRI